MQVEEKLLRINMERIFSLLNFILESMSHGFVFFPSNLFWRHKSIMYK